MKIDKSLFSNIINVDLFLMLLWITAFFGALIVILHFIYPTTIDFINKDNSSLVAALFILLSASIASASIMKSISANKELKEKEIANENKGKLLFMIHILVDIKNIYEITTLPTEGKDLYPKYLEIAKVNIMYSVNIWKKLLEDKYFIFISEKGYEIFQKLDNKINILHKIINHTASNDTAYLSFATKVLPYYKNTIVKNIYELLIILEDQNIQVKPFYKEKLKK